jgi:hypothetical protein
MFYSMQNFDYLATLCVNISHGIECYELIVQKNKECYDELTEIEHCVFSV